MTNYADGHQDFSHDVRVPAEVLEEVHALSMHLDSVEDNQAILREEVFTKIENEHNKLENQFFNSLMCINVFFRSKLVRFLNFFGQWFIYDDNYGMILANTRENAKNHKAPLLSRIKYWHMDRKEARRIMSLWHKTLKEHDIEEYMHDRALQSIAREHHVTYSYLISHTPDNFVIDYDFIKKDIAILVQFINKQ